jgi:hypothetical protein
MTYFSDDQLRSLFQIAQALGLGMDKVLSVAEDFYFDEYYQGNFGCLVVNTLLELGVIAPMQQA